MMEENLTKEAKERKILFDPKKKDEFFRMLKDDVPLAEIIKVIDERIGGKFRDWYKEKFHDIYKELQTLRQSNFEGFIRKTGINKYSLDKEDLSKLEKSLYTGNVGSIKELLTSRLP
jgi:hypothetical protein